MRKHIRSFIIGGFLASGLGALAVNIPYTFNAGSPIKASDINANFSSVKTAVDALEASAFSFGKFVGGSTTAPGLYMKNNGSGEGILGISESNQKDTAGIRGVNSSSTGQVVGVTGEAYGSPIGTGVVGRGSITGAYFEASGERQPNYDTPVGVYGVATKNMGVGVRGRGKTTGGWFSSDFLGLNVDGSSGAQVTSRSGSTLILNQQGNGVLINGNFTNGNEFTVLNNGDVRTSGSVISKGVTLVSDRNAKTNFSSVNGRTVLEKLSRLPISRWNYKTDATALKHIGPMAQDFHAAFGLNGSDDKHISVVDAQGVALAAIQGLNEKLETENRALRASLSALEARLAKLEAQK